jgi:hypothetical protein
MNRFAARRTRFVFCGRVCAESSTITYTRPAKGCSLLCTSGSTGALANNGRSPFSMGMSTGAKFVIGWGLPSSKIWKSSFFSSWT